MIIKYNEFLNEKLSDKLSGFNEEGLKQQFFNGKIDIKKYLEICKKHDLKLPTLDEIINHNIKNKLDLNTINQYEYVFKLKIPIKDKFKLNGYKDGFDNPDDFIQYLLDNSKETISKSGKIITYSIGKKISFKIYINEKLMMVNINILNILQDWFNMNDEQIYRVLQKYYKKYKFYSIGPLY